MSVSNKPVVVPQAENMGCLALIVRLTWMVIGSLLLVILGGLLLEGKGGIVVDALFWVVVAVMVGVRYIDITRFKGTTTKSEPATLGHWRRYAAGLAVLAGAVYAVAKLLNH